MSEPASSVVSCFIQAAESLLATDKLEQAHYCYTQALQLEPNSVELNLKQGNVWQKLGQIDLAIACYQKTVIINPDFWSSYHCLGDNHRQLQQYIQAIDAYQQAIDLNPDFFWSYYNLGITLLEIENFAEAIIHLNRAREIDPNYAPLLLKLANALQFQSHAYLTTALDCYQQAIANESQSSNLASGLQITSANLELSQQLSKLLT